MSTLTARDRDALFQRLDRLDGQLALIASLLTTKPGPSSPTPATLPSRAAAETPVLGRETLMAIAEQSGTDKQLERHLTNYADTLALSELGDRVIARMIRTGETEPRSLDVAVLAARKAAHDAPLDSPDDGSGVIVE